MASGSSSLLRQQEPVSETTPLLAPTTESEPALLTEDARDLEAAPLDGSSPTNQSDLVAHWVLLGTAISTLVIFAAYLIAQVVGFPRHYSQDWDLDFELVNASSVVRFFDVLPTLSMCFADVMGEEPRNYLVDSGRHYSLEAGPSCPAAHFRSSISPGDGLCLVCNLILSRP